MAASHASQLIVNLFGQLIERGLIACRPGFQQIGDFRVQEINYDTMAAFRPPLRLYRRQEIILQGGNMKSMLITGVTLMASLATAQTATTTYSVQDLGVAG